MAALSIGIVICVPLSIIVSRRKSLQWPTLAFASIMQTVPGIALLALMVPLLGMIGFIPALVALILYSMLPILRNGVTGIVGIDASLTEAARGIGMSPNQMLFRVELPLALPVLIAGIRTSAVWVVGTTTLATPVGATSLGNYIFGGLQTQNTTAVLVGCVAAAVLAIVLDQIIRLLELAASRRSRGLGVAGVMALVVLLGAGLLPKWAGQVAASDRATVTVGAKTFTEQFILADLLERRLKRAGFEVEVRSSLGSTVLFDAVADDLIDVYVDYSGTIWANAMNRDSIVPAAEMITQMTDWLQEQHGIRCLGTLGFENAYALAMRRAQAESLGIKSIADLAGAADKLAIGSDYEFFTRPEWSSLTSTYGLSFAGRRTLDPSLMYTAVAEGKVDVITAYSTDGRIVAYDLAVLDDPRNALPPYDAVLLVSSRAAQRNALVRELRGLIGVINDKAMRSANKLVDVDGRPVDEAAAFLDSLAE
ncbi:ABC transporter permease subunit [candidate division GN15 bacterium]|nr:ABC transporter permease subunit [candidate division GN15 bacterium]